MGKELKMIHTQIQKWLRMCEHRDCLEIFVSLRDTYKFKMYYLCDGHRFHAVYSDLECKYLHD